MIRNKAYYKREYVDAMRSMHDIAKEHNTYVNKIRREIMSYNYAIRDKSEAQKAALKSGRHKHPTKGTERSLEVKQKIAASVSEYRQNAKTKGE
jgi:hypothetical protein